MRRDGTRVASPSTRCCVSHCTFGPLGTCPPFGACWVALPPFGALCVALPSLARFASSRPVWVRRGALRCVALPPLVRDAWYCPFWSALWRVSCRVTHFGACRGALRRHLWRASHCVLSFGARHVALRRSPLARVMWCRTAPLWHALCHHFWRALHRIALCHIIWRVPSHAAPSDACCITLCRPFGVRRVAIFGASRVVSPRIVLPPLAPTCRITPFGACRVVSPPLASVTSRCPLWPATCRPFCAVSPPLARIAS